MTRRDAPHKIDSYELDYARRHLDYLRRSVDPEDRSILYWMMVIVLVVGLIIYVVADQITTGAIPLPAGWRADFVGDFLYNFGIALWTSVLVVFLLEVAVDLQKQVNRRCLRKIKQALGVPEALIPEDQKAASEALSQQLEAIYRRLDMLDELKAEIAAVKAFLTNDSR